MVDKTYFQQLKIAQANSHKGQNGRLLLIGGSTLFHAASLWSLTVASRIVDLVHYASVPDNNDIVRQAKEEFRNGMVIRRENIHAYIQEDDCILIGPGMDRTEETQELTKFLLKKYPQKQWVIDAGALQMIDVSHIPHHAILTPHHQEFNLLLKKTDHIQTPEQFANAYHCIVLLKGQIDIVTDGTCTEHVSGGNAGMTKGGTGDVLAGLVAALACTNDPFASAVCGSIINKQAGDDLFIAVGPFFNATDLADQIPQTMKRLLVDS
ncbi:MAG: NAD(P)H-hydrate dehydratase [Candidatus Gottesmanbacteria bacterium]